MMIKDEREEKKVRSQHGSKEETLPPPFVVLITNCEVDKDDRDTANNAEQKNNEKNKQ